MWLCIGEYKGLKKATHFLRYATSRYIAEQRELAYRIYITDLLRSSVRWDTPPTRFADLIGVTEQDTRSGDDIAIEVIERAGLVVKHDTI